MMSNELISEQSEEEVLLSILEEHGVELQDTRTIPTGQIRRMPNQPRHEFDPTAMTNLKNSIRLVEQLQDGLVRPLRPEELEEERARGSLVQYELVDGERRFRACSELGKDFKAKVAVGLTPKLQYMISVALNFNREPHNPVETMLAIKNLRSSGHTVKQTALIIGQSEPTVYKYIRLLELDDRIIERLGPPTPKEDRLGVSAAYELTAVVAERQWEAFLKLGKQPTVHHARSVIATFLADDKEAIHPDREPRRLDARDARRMMTRLAKRGEDAVTRISVQAIQGISQEHRQALDSQFQGLIEALGELQTELRFDFPQKDGDE